MKLHFDSNQQYQLDAIRAVTGIFEGQPPEDSLAGFDAGEDDAFDFINGVANRLTLSEAQIFENLKAVQAASGVPVAESLEGMNFSVEMETGTGKTYVYLRTVYELSKLYGFKKFVVVVPSIPIKEGVLKNLEITHEHFQTLYGNAPLHFSVYDSAKPSALRAFATNGNIEILVLNIDSFAKDENIINKPNDRLSGREPIAFIRAACPIVIVDEPQNMETEKRREAIGKLNALCTLRYSATHKNRYNLVYSLNPVKAYDLGLVKQIEVDSVVEENSYNDAFVAVESITAAKTKVTARLSINCNDGGGVRKKAVNVRAGDDLYRLSNGREIYRSGYIVEEIDAVNRCVSISNGSVLHCGQTQGDLTDEVMKFQIRKTVEEHLKKENKLNRLGIKVLSLFFIDRVANYRSYDAAGNSVKGKFALWFEAIYRECMSKPAFRELDKFPLAETHNGYFSQDKKGVFKDTTGETKADDDTYSLIMRDKEKLLDLNNPLRFIFSHSALREGWDNPNVFQICTLNESKSDMKKRQEIGRGLRLAVDRNGNRTHDKNINRLTVVANESYDDFAKTLQREIEEDCGVEFKDRIQNKRNREKITYRKGFEADPKFLELWERLKRKTNYRVDYDTAELIVSCAKAIKALPEIRPPSIRSTKAVFDMSAVGIAAKYVGESATVFDGHIWEIPDILAYIQGKTELTRSTIMDMLVKSGRLRDALQNPQLFLDLCSQAIRRELHSLMIDGIRYTKINGAEYEMTLFEAQELETYLNGFTFNVRDNSKTIYERYMPLDSAVESRFARDCENSEQVKFYFKLPSWFKIPTPIGNYNPDWALVPENEKKIYFVAETKDTGTPEVELSKLGGDEQLKIKCGKAHFNEFEDVEYKVVNRVGQLIT